jgi:hypothetical protein
MKRPKIRNLIQNDGLTQPDRFLEELDPQFAKIDDRTLIDLLAFAWKYSDHLLFFEAAETGQGEEVLQNGSWQQLLRHEQLFCLALISGSSPVKYSLAFEAALETLDPDKDSVNQWEDKIYHGFVQVVSLCEEVDEWSNWLPIGSKGARDLKIYIGQLEKKVEQLLAYYRPVGGGKLWGYVSANLKDWDIDQYGAASPGPALPSHAETVSALRNIFGEVQTIYAAIVNNAKQTVATSLVQDSHQAHIGLFLAFLRLLEHNRDHLNQLTGRHLDFYLRQILKLEPQKRTPDSVNLTFELTKKVGRHRLVAGTAFKGGKNEDKVERLYDLKNELALSRATVAQLKNIHATQAVGARTVSAGAVADSLDGQGRPLPEDNPKWPGFGTSSYPFAELGFVIASPLLRLSEGERQVTLAFTVADLGPLKRAYAAEFDSATADEVPLPELFSARVSTAKGWHDCRPNVTANRKTPVLTLVLAFDMDVPPIVDYDAEKLADPIPLPARWPVLRLTVDQKGQPPAYAALCQLRATRLALKLEVDKVRKLVLGNDAAKLKADKPFLPFGSQPRIDSSFFIGHAESFAKPLTRVSLAWQWVDPPQSLEAHYQNYTDEAFQFSADVDLRENYNWDHALAKKAALSVVADPASYGEIAALAPEKLKAVHQAVQKMSSRELKGLKSGTAGVSLPAEAELTEAAQKALQRRFVIGQRNAALNLGRGKRGTMSASGRPEPKAGAGEISAADIAAATESADAALPQFVSEFSFDISGYDTVSDVAPFVEYSETLRQGGLRLRLKTPAFAFGHKLYPKLHSQALAAALNSASPDSTLIDTLQRPYTPMFESLELSYRAEETFSLAAADANLQMLLLHPFGYSKPVQGALVADYPDEGSLYIGLADLAPPQNLSLLIQLAEGSGDPFKTAPRAVVWSYLTDAGWLKFTTAQILRDATLGFLQSGIIEFSLPPSMSSAQPELPRTLHWLRVTVTDNTAALHDVLAVTAQAGVAVYRDEGHRAKHLATALPAGSVAKMLVRDTAVKTVSQPFASYGGREAETDREFHTRSSERLRHKDRAVGLWDYEHLVLKRFPEIYKVKCLNHTCPESEFSPGNVMLVLIPDLRNRNSRYPLRPAVPQSLLEAVKQFVRKRCSAHLDIHVVNPFYERIAVGGVAHFHRGFDQGIYQKQLHQDITDGLTPWLRGAKDIHFGGRIHSSVILNLIEELRYVDYLSAFTVAHYVGPDDTHGRQVDEIITTSNRSILVSNDRHTIQGVSAQ